MNRHEQIAAALHEVRARIADAAARAGRAAGSVRLVAVSKKMPPDAVRAALAAGQRDFGENYAQELRDKRAALAADGLPPARADEAAIQWHYLGPLQRNKVKYLAGQVALIQSVDAADLLAEIDQRTATFGDGARQACLVQVNVAGETRKGGVPTHRLAALLDSFVTASHTTCAGLMLIPPFDDDEGETRRHFAALRALAEREARVARPHVELTELSMGMSGDFAAAVAEGATIVRVGTAIFGDRPPR
ncbi:MAG: YggS family pyridoxal phosphate-dependent enzyme [Verrucomicrobiota bacterium]